MGMLIFYSTLALSVSFLCSLLEASLLSVSIGHVNALAEKEHKGALLMRRYKTRPDRPLAAILSSNTVAHTVGAAGVGAQVAHIWGDDWLGLASAILTVVILLATEIVPKTLGTLNANALVTFTARVVQVMIFILFPLVIAAEMVGRLVSGKGKAAIVSRDEVAAIAEIGMSGGSLSESEAQAIRNLLSLRTIRVSDIMTPRTVVDHAKGDLTVGEFAESGREILFARTPITEDGNVDNVIGLIHRAWILNAVREGETAKTLREMARSINSIPQNAPAASAMEVLLKQSEHMLLVVDEYGGTAGVITLEDVMETLLGVEIVDETDRDVDMRELARALQQQRFGRRKQKTLNIQDHGEADTSQADSGNRDSPDQPDSGS